MDTVEFQTYKAHIEDSSRLTPKSSTFIPPWIFNEQDLTEKLETAKKIDQERLINTLNYLNFSEDCLFVQFNHLKYEEGILIKAHPDVCRGNILSCRWTDEIPSQMIMDNYIFQQLIIADGDSLVLIPGMVKDIRSDEITIHLPDVSYDICRRKLKRYRCENVHAEIIQDGFLYQGIIVDFSARAFRIRLLRQGSSSFNWLNLEVPVHVHIKMHGRIVFSGHCQCVRTMNDFWGREIVFSPIEDKISRFKKTKIRNPRIQLSPPPIFNFCHPLFNRKIKRRIHDISNTGFSVFENSNDRVLIPGMILSDASIKYAGTIEIKCTAQVIYSQEEGENVRNGCAILDMEVDAFSRLSQIIGHSKDHHGFICNRVDMNALWEFFFNTGFIYPKKYDLIRSHKNEFKETYRKLYVENPEIARHFTYENNGKIYGHMSMMRAYEKTWMIQHHAARNMDNKLPGLQVLKQAMIFLHGIYHLPSANMDYVMCYYRPENRFPDRAFGGFTRDLNCPQGSSLDLFSYVTHQINIYSLELPEGWSLEESTPQELWILNYFYRYHSGGNLMNILQQGEKELYNKNLETEFRRLGFLRKWKLYSLTYENNLNAVLIVNQSNLGVNLSELLNGITIIVLNQEYLGWEVVIGAVKKLSNVYDVDKIPLLVYPSTYLEDKNVPYEKQYQLWITDMQYANQFLEYMQKRFRMKYE